MNAFPFIHKLVACGYSIQITQGRLSVTDVRNQNRELTQKEEDGLLSELGRLLSTNLLSYTKHSCGLYTVKTGTKSSGLTLQMKKHGYPQENFYSVFNVSTTYKRSGANHKAGDPLPKGRFIALRQGNFVKFWLACGLELPDDGKVSAFHKYMGRLRPIIASGTENPRHPERYNNLSPVTISMEAIKAELNAKQALTKPLISPNTSLRSVPKHFHTTEAEQGFQTNSGTWPKSTVKGKQEKVNHGGYRAVKEGTRILQTERPHTADQASEDWLSEYSSAPSA